MPFRVSCSSPLLCLSLLRRAGRLGPRVSLPVSRWCLGVSGVRHSPSPWRLSLGRAGGARCRFSLRTGRAGVGAGNRPDRAQFCELARRAVEAAAGRPGGGGGFRPPLGLSGLGHSPFPNRPSLGRATGACCHFSLGAGGAGVGSCHQPHSTRSCELVLCAVGAAGGGPGWGAPSASVRSVQGWVLSLPQLPVLEGCSRGPLPFFFRRRGRGRRVPSPAPQRTLLRTGAVRY